MKLTKSPQQMKEVGKHSQQCWAHGVILNNKMKFALTILYNTEYSYKHCSNVYQRKLLLCKVC